MSLTQAAIQKKFKELFPTNTNAIHLCSVGGGCINESYNIRLRDKQFFCKINSASNFPHLFETEAYGLKLIALQNIIKVPEVIGCYEFDQYQMLVLEWIDEGPRTEAFWKKFGEQLSALHQVSNDFFGLKEDNYMGSIVQCNKPADNWIDFFIGQRLQPLIEQCLFKKLLSPNHQSQFEKLYRQLPSTFDKEQKPALVHGDLWSGNFMCNKNSEPVLIDTAVYFGHPAVDMAMTTLFGGFHPAFYESYHYHNPFPSNFKEQWEVYNLYPLLIHLVLFGSGYLSQIEAIVGRYT